MKPRGGRGLRVALIGLAGLVVLVVGAAAVFLATFDANSYKPRVIAAVKQATGRDLALNGPIGLKLSLWPEVEARDVAFANPPGFSRPQMVTLERLDVRVALIPLLSGHVEVERLILVRPDIRLEIDAKGQTNWQMQPEGGAPAPSAQPQAGSREAGQRPQIAASNVQIQDGTLEYRDGQSGKSMVLAIKQLTAAMNAGSDALRITTDAAYNGAPLAIAATIGALAGNQPLPVDVTIQAAGISLTAKGSITDTNALSGVRIDLAVQVPDLKALSPLAQTDMPALTAVAFQAVLTDLDGGLAKGVALRDLKLVLPMGSLAGEATIGLSARPALTADLKSDRFDLDALAAALGKPAEAARAQAAPAHPPGPAPAKSGRIFSDQPMPFDAMKQADADLRLAIAALRTGGADYKAITAHAVLKDGRLQVDPIAADLPGGHLDAKLAVDASQTAPPVSLSAHAPGLALAPMLAAAGLPGYATGNLEVYADLHGAGQSPHAIAASLDGTVGLALANGTMDDRLLGGTIGGLLEKANLPDITGHAGNGDVRCFAARLDAHHGVGTFKALQLASTALTMDGSGTVNLGDETLNLRLRPQGRMAGTGIVVPANVTGPIRSPRVAVDAIGTAGSNAGTIAGAVVGNATPLGLLGGVLGADKLLGTTAVDPCPAALAIARGKEPPAAAATPAAAEAPATVQPSAQPKAPKPADVLRNLFR